MMPVHGMALARHAFEGHRKLIVTLLVVLIGNLIAFALLVYPLSQRVANVEQRNAAAELALGAARADFAQANGTLTGKDRASTELATFYEDVLPTDLSGARRATQLRLRQLARDSNLAFERDTYEPLVERGTSLTRLRISMVLSGSYADIRAFLYELETAPEFVVTDNVELAEGAEGGALVVTLEMSTYYRGQP